MARHEDPESLRARFGRNYVQNVVYVSPDARSAIDVCFSLFDIFPFLPFLIVVRKYVFA